MLDSGSLAGVGFDEPADLMRRAVAYQLNLPLTHWSESFLNAAERLAIRHHLLNSLPYTDFGEFSEACQDLAPNIRNFAKELQGLRLAGLPHFSHPLHRHLKDHFSIRIFEVLGLIATRNKHYGSDQPPLLVEYPFLFRNGNFRFLYKVESGSVLAFGPLFIEDKAGQGADSIYHNQAAIEIKKFNSCVGKAHQNSVVMSDSSNRYPLYAEDYLLRLYFCRPKISRDKAGTKIKKANLILEKLHDYNLDDKKYLVSPGFYSKLTAAIATHERGLSGNFRFKTYAPSALRLVRTASLSDERLTFPETAVRAGDPDFLAAYEELTETSFLSWSTSLAESMAQLRHWLGASRVWSPGEPTDWESRGGIAGGRLARFLAAAFNAYECTIYRLAYAGGMARLTEVGAFSKDRNGPARLRRMQIHMAKIAGTPTQDDSISYRCMSSNEIQYCEYWDQRSLTALPKSQPISYPKGDSSDWGTSACAIPIRVNGMQWGVLQLIGSLPHSFPEIVRAKAEEACSIIGEHLFRTDMLASIYEINKAIVSNDLPSLEKRKIIERCLSHMFGCKTFAIIRIDPTDRKLPVNVFMQDGRLDLIDAASGRAYDAENFAPFIKFYEGSAEYWSGVIGGSEFRRLFGSVQRRKFYEQSDKEFLLILKLNWELSSEVDLPGVIVLTYPHPMADQENWRDSVDFVAQYISTISGALYSSDLWERRLREKIGHELSKTAHNLKASILRLSDRASRTSPQSHEISQAVPAVIGDLGRHSKSLERYVQILTTHRDVTDFDTDPRLYLIDQLKREYRNTKSRQWASLRQVYNATFLGQRKRFEERHLDLPNFDSALSYRIDMDEFCLREVFSTLVDNLLKYAKPDTAIIVRDASDRLVGLTISNIGLKLDPDEIHTVFDDSVRGRRAREFLPDEGSGFGLWFAQKAMHAWGCGLRHRQRPLKDPSGKNDAERFAWHDFTLDFPRRMVMS
jgi:signal transduction histidine kinase